VKSPHLGGTARAGCIISDKAGEALAVPKVRRADSACQGIRGGPRAAWASITAAVWLYALAGCRIKKQSCLFAIAVRDTKSTVVPQASRFVRVGKILFARPPKIRTRVSAIGIGLWQMVQTARLRYGRALVCGQRKNQKAETETDQSNNGAMRQ